MNVDLNKAELNNVARGLIMIEKSIGRKMKDGDLSSEMATLLGKEQAEIYALRNRVTQHVLNFDAAKKA